jgi:hypothetical protein
MEFRCIAERRTHGVGPLLSPRSRTMSLNATEPDTRARFRRLQERINPRAMKTAPVESRGCNARSRKALASRTALPYDSNARSEFRFDGLRHPEYPGTDNHLSRAGKPATSKSTGFFIFRLRTTRRRTSRCQHAECGESHGSTTRTTNRCPVSPGETPRWTSRPGKTPGTMRDRTDSVPHHGPNIFFERTLR